VIATCSESEYEPVNESVGELSDEEELYRSSD